MPVLDNIFKAQQKYRRCILADIVPHFEQIKHWVPVDEHEAFLDRMADAVEEETAYCTENTFLYYRQHNKRFAIGIALFGRDFPEELLSMFIGVFSSDDTHTCMLKFKLHPGKFIEEYKCMLTDVAIERYHRDPTEPLVVRVDAMRQKIYKRLEWVK